VRVMPCTLKEDLLPGVLVVKEGAAPRRGRPLSDTILSVWCTDKAEWRSFKVANVTEVKVLS
jgi:hypothetical protein